MRDLSLAQSLACHSAMRKIYHKVKSSASIMPGRLSKTI